MTVTARAMPRRNVMAAEAPLNDLWGGRNGVQLLKYDSGLVPDEVPET